MHLSSLSIFVAVLGAIALAPLGLSTTQTISSAQIMSESVMNDPLQDFMELLETSPDSIIFWQQMVQRYPSHSHWSRLGHALFDEMRYEEAAEAYKEAISLAPEDPDSHVMLAITLEELGDWAATITAYQSALELDPTNSSAHQGLARALSQSGQYAAAETAYKQLIQQGQQSNFSYYELADTLYEQNKLDEAEAINRAFLERLPDWPWGYEQLGRILSARNQLDKAEQAYRTAIQLETERIASQDEETTNQASNTVRLEPHNSSNRLAQVIVLHYVGPPLQAPYYLGKLLEHQQKWTEAQTIYQEAIAANVDEAMQGAYHYRLGLTLHRQNRFVEAEEAYQISIDFNFEEAVPYNEIEDTPHRP